MKKMQEFIRGRVLIPAAFAAAVVLALIACAPAVEPAGETPPLPPPAGKGVVNIQLGVDDSGVVPSASVARTLLPATPLVFDSYDLTFTPEEGDPVVKEDVTALTGIELDAGTYTLDLKAYKGDEVAAEGSKTGILVTASETPTDVTVFITFNPTQEGTGTLSVTVENTSAFILSGTKFAWKPLSGGTEAGSENLSGSGLSGSKELKAGYYVVTVTLSTNERTAATKADVAHIGADSSTILDQWIFAAGDFSTTVEDIWLLGNDDQWQAYDSANKLSKPANGTFVWEGQMTHGYFLFSLEDTSENGWEGDKDKPDRFQAAAADTPVTLGEVAFMTFAARDSGAVTKWSLGGTGYYRFVVNPLAKTVTVTKFTGPLPPPASVTLSGAGLAEWTGPIDESNVVSYSVQLYKGADTVGDPRPVTKGTYSENFLLDMRNEGAGVYTVKVKALGDGTNYSESSETVSGSQTVSVRDVVQTLTWVETSKAQWVNVDAGDYTVQLYKDGSESGSAVPVTRDNGANTTHVFTSAITGAGSGTYTFGVVTKGDNALILDSPESAHSSGYLYTATPTTFAITANQPETGGSFTVKAGGTDVTEAEVETTITLTATADFGYRFKEWTVTGATLSSNTANPVTFSMPSAAVTVTAVFEQVYTVTFNVGDATGGPEPVTVAAGGSVDTPDVSEMASSDPNASNNPFGGWFTDTTLRYPVEFPITVNEDTEVYAKWDNKYVLIAGEKKNAWQLAGQVVQLTAGTYKLGAEYKSGRYAAENIYSQVIISVQWVTGGATQSPAFFHKFEGNNTSWTRDEVTFIAPVDGWYRIGIEDSSRNTTVEATEKIGNRRAYANRVWLYPENATSSTENILVDADFAGNFLSDVIWRDTGDRFLNVENGNPFETNSNYPSWVALGDYWGWQCFKWWGKTGGNLWIESNPSIENY
jgi:hypothetical protein